MTTYYTGRIGALPALPVRTHVLALVQQEHAPRASPAVYPDPSLCCPLSRFEHGPPDPTNPTQPVRKKPDPVDAMGGLGP